MSDTEPIRITDKLYILPSPTGGRFPMANAFLALGNDAHALIDTGCGPEACRLAQERFGVDLVVNSHCHPDHVSGNHLFSGKELWVPAERVEETGAIKRLSLRLVGPDEFVMQSWESFVQEDLGMRDYTPTKTYGEGDVLDLGGISLQAIHTPGHLEDHYCFLIPGENILLTFDIDLTAFGPFYGNPEADIRRFVASMEKVMEIAPRVAASSHRMPVEENVREELEAFTAKFARNEERVAAVLDKPRTIEEICAKKPIFGKYLPGVEVIYSFFEKTMIEKHLECMEQEGGVKMEGGVYIRTR
ncbi:MAG: MBL fold metallo-hydrolase [Deltaproteobacteria bacterium]|nr:MBL fold metallo-hydrolase [Deltaproteobacteria bacterium]